MRINLLKGSSLLAACCSLLAVCWAAPHYPPVQGHVTDAAHILDASTRNNLETQLRAFEQSTSIEIAVATVASLEGEPIENYAVGLFKEWGVGKKGKDNGVLLLVAPNDRKARIEVGYGLEGQLPDGFTGEIIRLQMLPSFRQGRYPEGIALSIQAVINRLNGKQALPSGRDRPNPSNNLFGLFAVGFFLFIMVMQAISRRGSGIRGRAFYGGWGGGFGGGFSGGGGGFGGFGGGSSGGGGASGSW